MSGHCGAASFSDNPDCGTSDCPRLEELSQGCLGSHTEQDCIACGITYVQVGGDDHSTPYYDEQGEMVALKVVGEGDETCADAWYGIDLSDCVPSGDVRQVLCDSSGP